MNNNNISKKVSHDTLRRFLKNKAAILGFIILLFLIYCSLFPSTIAKYGYDDQDISRSNISPCREYPFGTDNLGRDILSRVIYGTRISLGIGISSIGVAAVIGIVLGAISGYYGGFTDNIIMRFMDIILAIPSILLAISIVAALGNSMVNLVLAIGISTMPRFSRIVRSSILSIKSQEYIEASKCMGANDFRIIAKHIIPNCFAPIIVQITMGVASAILSAASLSFIGLGVNPPLPEWGTMLSSGRAYIMNYGYMVIFPGIAIMITIFALNLLGDGLRDALDPKLKR